MLQVLKQWIEGEASESAATTSADEPYRATTIINHQYK